MKRIICGLALMLGASMGFAQTRLVSMEDVKYLLHNNLLHADTFLTAKGFTVKARNDKKKNREYLLTIKGGTFVNLKMRQDGKKIFIELETNELSQYDLINSSISQYINKAGSIGDVQAYYLKELCNIYITVTDAIPYDPLKKDYDMQIVADKNVIVEN
jgi:hypothetical protein